MTTILKTLVGSRAHGLETPESDEDWRSVFVRPTDGVPSASVHENDCLGELAS